MKKFLIDKGIYSTRMAVVGKHGPEMISYETKTGGVFSGDIYIGRVKSINKANSSAFLELGVSDCYLDDYVSDVKVGDMVIVQIDKEAHDGKLPSAKRDIGLVGKYTVFLSKGSGVKHSRKVENLEEIEIITKELSNKLEGCQGLIIRSSVNLSLKEEVIKELDSHIRTYNDFENKMKLSTKPLLLKAAHKSYVEQLIGRDEAYEIITNCKDVISEVKPFLLEGDTIDLNYTSLFSIYGIGDDFALKKEYKLNGANIVVEKTEAMTVIDINSGNKSMNLNRDTNNLEINLSLCDKIVELIILKNLSGIIIIDFINMKEKKNKDILLDRLKKAFKKDYNQVKVMEITSLGLVQVTRKRRSEDVYSRFTEDCHHCKGTGKLDNLLSKKIKAEEEIQLKGYEYVAFNNMEILEIFSSDEKIALRYRYENK